MTRQMARPPHPPKGNAAVLELDESVITSSCSPNESIQDSDGEFILDSHGRCFQISTVWQSWPEAREQGGERVVNIMWPGDSILEGFNADEDDSSDTFWGLVTEAVAEYMTPGTTHGLAWEPIESSDFPPTPPYLHWDDTVGDHEEDHGWGGWARSLDGDTATRTETCRGFLVEFTGGAGSVDISIDGDLLETIDLSELSLTSGHRWSSPVLPLEEHVLEVEGTGGAIVDGSFVIQDNWDTGLRSWNGGHSGWGLGVQKDHAGIMTRLAAEPPDLLLVWGGITDYLQSLLDPLTAEEFGTLVGDCLDSYFEVIGDNCDVGYIYPFRTNLMPPAIVWGGPFRTAAREACVSRGVRFIDLFAVIQDVEDDGFGEALSDDQVHLIPAGHAVVAGVIEDALL